jgi:hypothetical protein
MVTSVIWVSPLPRPILTQNIRKIQFDISKNKRRMETRNQILSMIQKFGNPAKNASTFKFGGWGEAGRKETTWET